MRIDEKPLPPPGLNLIPPNDDYPFFEDWSGHPFVADALGFELVNAWRLADAALPSVERGGVHGRVDS